MNRKDFITLSASAAAFLGLPLVSSSDDITQKIANTKHSGSAMNLNATPIKTVRIGIVGMGNRGAGLLEMFDWMIAEGHAEVRGLSDIVEKKCLKGAQYLQDKQDKAPAVYTKGAEDWKTMVDKGNIDLLIVCTPWSMHAEMCKYAMEQGVHVATEVPAALTLDEMNELISISERTGIHCMMLENCCFNDEELFVLNMIEEGVFGELTHAECAYLHDLRMHLINETYYENQWRLREHTKRDGNLYPTHGIGPVSMYMNITRGDTFDRLVSMSSLEKGLSEALKTKNRDMKIPCGDVNTTLIKTKKGRSIMVQFDVHSGRPYSRINQVVGTGAVHEGYPSRLYLNKEIAWGGHEWLNQEEYNEMKEKYRHPIWQKLQGEAAKKKMGHGGMDFIIMYRLIRCLNKGLPLDINVYESMLWSSIAPLSELSVSQGSAPVPVPDFTGGLWKNEVQHPVFREV